MAKDRFKTRASYDNSFKYGISDSNIKPVRTITCEQVDFIKLLYKNPKLSNWEKSFLKSVVKQNSISDKQVEVIKRINRLKNN